MNKTWLITGVSTGFGNALMRAVAESGDTVIGTVRRPEQLAEIEAIHPGLTHARLLDVRHEAQVKDVVAEVISTFGRIDVLVNNAGYGLIGAIEECSDEECREQFDTDVFGVLNLCRYVLPQMRHQKAGWVIQIASVGGVVSFPGVGIYNASKYALEGLSESLAKEAGALGVKVLIVEPGPFRTEWAGQSMRFAKNELQDYAESAGKRRKMFRDYNGTQPGDPYRGALAMIQAINSPNPPLRLPLGEYAVSGIRTKLKSQLEEVDAWEKVALDTAFTE